MNNDCSGQELQEFWAMIGRLPDNNFLTQELKAAWENNWNEFVSINKQELFNKVLARAKSQKAHIIPQRRLNWTRMAAAVIILMLGAGTYFLFFNHAPKKDLAVEPQEKRFKNDILPSHQRATLTLANGKKILLDSAGNGKLTQQGNMQVLKQGEQIVYAGETNGQAAVLYNTMATEKGKQYMLTLADGSKAWLNAASSITYPIAFAGNERKVTVTGEVYFEVAHNVNMPFMVQKNDMSVQVLGTHFNVNAYDDEMTIKTTLLEGSVRVTKGNSSMIITPGQQARVTMNGELKVANVNAEKVMAWKNNLFWFDNDDIQTIMREVARWYDAEIVYEGNVTNHYGFMLERNLPVSKLLKILELTGGVHFTIEGNKITVRK